MANYLKHLTKTAQRTPQTNQQQAMQPIRTDGEQLALRVAE